MAAQFEYDRHGFEGYLGNVGLRDKLSLTRKRPGNAEPDAVEPTGRADPVADAGQADGS